MSPLLASVTAMAILGLAAACGSGGSSGPVVDSNGGREAASSDQSPGSEDVGEVRNGHGAPAEGPAPVHGYEVVQEFPHDRMAYTQGLLIVDGRLYESTGKRGESTVRLVDLETGDVIRKHDLPGPLFGEGLAAYQDLLIQLTWNAGRALVYNRKTLQPLYEYSYEGEGWGLAWSGEHFVMSDGTDELRFLAPKGFEEVRRIKVTDFGRPVLKLNELEWIDGEIWANVWQTDRIARIDPATGKVKSWVDLRGILKNYRVADPNDEVLNGIAWDPASGAIYVTGKRWPKLYSIRVVE